MLTLRNALFVIRILAVLATAAALGDQALQSAPGQNSSLHNGGTHERDMNISHTTHPVHTESHASAQGDHAHTDLDTVAIDDIHRYAEHHLLGAVERPNTLHVTHDWEGDWELHSIDYDIAGHLVRIYHAVHKYQPGLRYASALHDSDGHYLPWQRVE